MAPPSQLYTGRNQIAGFFSGGQSSNGMKLEDILKFTFNKLESEHNYIQMLFPIHTRSSNNLNAPLVDQETIELYSKCEDLRGAHLAILDYMLLFFSLKRDGDLIMPSRDFNHQKPSWLNQGDHNQFRLTRMVQSLYLLGNEKVAESLLNAIISISFGFNGVNETTLGFWFNAITEAKAFKDTQNAAQGGASY